MRGLEQERGRERGREQYTNRIFVDFRFEMHECVFATISVSAFGDRKLIHRIEIFHTYRTIRYNESERDQYDSERERGEEGRMRFREYQIRLLEVF